MNYSSFCDKLFIDSVKGDETLNLRLKKIRKNLKLTQDAFGERLGITGSAISKLESGASGITEQLIKSICKEFHVDYVWFTTGKGDDMFFQDDGDNIDLMLDDLLADEDELVRNVFKMFKKKYTVDDWKNLFKVIQNSAAYLQELQEESTEDAETQKED